ncbi:MAG: hypothetical protein M3203_09090, partial [Actinomycetota bacterium]|nr:hypothetical protein [Actinomycetota bacterium]
MRRWPARPRWCAVADQTPSPTRPSPAAWGVADGYSDAAGRWREPPPSTLDAVLAAPCEDGPPRPRWCAVADQTPSPTRSSPAAWGVAEGYSDAAGSWKRPPPSTLEAVLAALGVTEDRPSPESPVVAVRPGSLVA